MISGAASEAKQKVLDWVRSKNPNTITPNGCHKCDDVFGYKTLGLQDLLIALDGLREQSEYTKVVLVGSHGVMHVLDKVNEEEKWTRIADYAMGKNLHEQYDDFYKNILPLIPQ